MAVSKSIIGRKKIWHNVETPGSCPVQVAGVCGFEQYKSKQLISRPSKVVTTTSHALGKSLVL